MSKTVEWIAFCLTCESILDKTPNGFFAEGAARHHKRKYPTHGPVLVGYQVELEESERPPILDKLTEELGAVYVPLKSEDGETK